MHSLHKLQNLDNYIECLVKNFTAYFFEKYAILDLRRNESRIIYYLLQG